jgi:adenine-specific DNA-methyltransferase
VTGQIRKPKQALNKAYLKLKPTRDEIEKFKKNLILLIDKIDIKKNEEHTKNLFRDFLLDTYYKDLYEINVKDRNDLVIHSEKTSASPVSVIIEAKRPSEKYDFPTVNNLNVKAMHELVLYYLRERVDCSNSDIRHLIATNGYEWFIFDGSDFYKYFYSNSALLKEYNKWNAGQKDSASTRLFYEEIAKKYIEEIKNEIPFTYFNINDYDKFLRNENKEDDKNLIPLFKLLSPPHLLKLSFSNDSNSLDKNFYFELLHIIGLEEVKDGSKKIIQRKNVPDEGSLLENAINILKAEDLLYKVNNPESFGKTKDDQYFGLALELCITWMNRILFLKLLEAQLLKYQKGDKEYKFLTYENINNFDELNKLFFQVLALSHDSRSDSVKKKFPNIPYLNSSLFESSGLESDLIRISNLEDDALIPIISKTVLKETDGRKKSGKVKTLKYLLDFLDSYDFGSEGSEDIQEERKTLINSSVLGLIFEKINGYKDGSFFTPGFITMYMCRETIRRAVIQKFKEAKGWDCADINSLYNKIEDRNEANNIINTLKICDPAVGSGHFLVSVLNEIIAIKSDLKILQDQDGKRLKEYHFEVVSDELIITDEDGELFEYNPASKESQRIQETVFHEKQTIIENCLFGVDINHNSVKICRLRLWIELLKNAYYTKASNYKELETLPNIDINIKCGNSLVSRFGLDADLSSALRKSKWTITAYRLAVQSYQNAKTKDEKRDLEKLLNEIKNNFRSEISVNDPKQKKLERLENELYEKYTSNKLLFVSLTDKEKAKEEKEKLKLVADIEKTKAEIKEIKDSVIYRNAFEWRFEFPEVLDEKGNYIGFDVVIGNPPYIYNRDLEVIQREFLKNKYTAADDLYVYFTYEGLRVIKENGFLSLITPNTYFTLFTRTNYRKNLLDYSELGFTYSGFCFEDAYVETMIQFIRKKNSQSGDITFVTAPNDYVSYNEYRMDKSNAIENIYNRFYIPTDLNIIFNEKFNAPLKNVAEKYQDYLSGKGDSKEIENYNKKIKPGDITLLGLITDGEQGLVTGNNSKYIGKVVNSETELQASSKSFVQIFNNHSEKQITTHDFIGNLNSYYDEAEKLKTKTKKPTLFGKFFLYRCVFSDRIKKFSDITEKEKKEGGNSDLWIFYNRGNSEGYKWYVPYSECINWSKDFVKELREGIVTNSRWQGSKYFGTTGFGWVDYFTDKLKAFFVEEGVYSKNIVKLHSINEFMSDKFIVALLNSKFISYYVKNFITTTHTLQINDGRLIPIIVPTRTQNTEIEKLVDRILEIKILNIKTNIDSLEYEIDKLVYRLYGLTEEEINIVERG